MESWDFHKRTVSRVFQNHVFHQTASKCLSILGIPQSEVIKDYIEQIDVQSQINKPKELPTTGQFLGTTKTVC